MFPAIYCYGQESTVSKEVKNAAYEASENFARCSALFLSIANQNFIDIDNESKPLLSKGYKELSNGAHIASAWILASGNIMEWNNALSYAEGIKETAYTGYMLSFNDKTFKNQISMCETLNPLQHKLVTQARRSLHESGTLGK